jgi:hypothetical protein
VQAPAVDRSPDGAQRNPGPSCFWRKPRIALRSIRATRPCVARRAKHAIRMCRPFGSILRGDLAASYSVIARAAKQSRVFPQRDSGLLRYARNDEEESVCDILRSRARTQRSVPSTLRCRAGAHLAVYRAAPGSRLCAATLRALQRVRDTNIMTDAAANRRLWRDRIGSTKNPLSTVARRTLMNRPRLVHKRRPAAGGSPPRRVLG